MKKRYLTIIFLLILLPVMTFAKQTKEPWRIGVIIPLTGEWAKYGQQMKEGVDLAVEKVNRNGGIRGRQVKIQFEDGMANPKNSLQAFNKLIQIDKVQAVVSGFSGVILALAQMADENKVILLNSGATSPKIEGSGKYVFSNIPNANHEARFLATYTYQKLGVRKLALFWQNNDAGLGMRDVFSKTFTSLGGEILADISHEQGQKDFRTQLFLLKDKNPPAVFAPTYAKEMGLILKESCEMGFKPLFLSYAAFEVNEVIDIAKECADAVIYSYYSFDPGTDSKHVKDFVRSFKVKYGKDPGLYSATFYDGVTLIMDALKNNKVKGDEIRNYLLSVKGFKGVAGDVTFNENGAVITPLMIKTVKDGKFIKYGKQ